MTYVDPRAPTSARPLAARAVVDAAFVLGLTAIALYGLRTTYSGTGYLVTGVVAAVLGVAVASLVTAVRGPAWVVLPLLPIAYFLLGGAIALGHPVPTGAVLDQLASVLVGGWKELLTTLPPVAGSGRLLAIPYVLGLLAGVVGAGTAQHTNTRFAPALGPALALVAVLLLGTAQPAAKVWQGVAFSCAVVCWAALRRPDARPITFSISPGTPQRAVIGLLVLTIAGVGAVWLGPRLPGNSGHRVVLRDYVKPPFDIAAYPSPLAGFRKYTKDAHLLYDQTLFTERGLPSGVPVRLATLDAYDGSVWGATNGTVPSGPGQPIDAFQRVGSRIGTSGGPDVRATVTIDAPYASASDIDAWVPSVGTLRSITFTGANGHAHEEQFRYNLATGAGVVADRFAAGDRYTIQARATSRALPKDAAPYGSPTIDPAQDAFVASRANQWSARTSGVIPQALAVARYMRDNGAYSDGGPGEAQYLPGHSAGRLTSFLNAQQLVGDDEQYAAAYALICNYLGLPARVVLLAEPEANGRVQGKDVHTAVEVHVRSGGSASWIMIARSQFMPDQTKKPNKQPPQTVQDAHAAVVPPPNPVQPPSTLDEPDRPEQNTQHLGKLPREHPGALSGWFGAVVLYAGIPVAALALIALLIIGTKWRRRALRRSRGPVPDRFDAGWRELMDCARDLGATVPTGRTRQEQATALASRPAGEVASGLAAAADAGVFGPGDPPPEAAAEFWQHVDGARRTLTRAAGRAGRLRAALNLRSLLRPTRPVRTS
jgi:hypothetical protein